MIRDSRHTPPPDRYGVPGRQFPTPNILDAVFIEEVPRYKEGYAALLPGTPHPSRTNYLLVGISPLRGDNNEIAPHYVFCSTRSAQDAYNGHITYADEAHLYPTYERTYFLPRVLAGVAYAPDTEDTALTAVIGLLLVTAGTVTAMTGDGRLDLTFSGGGGSGAAGIAQISRGRIVAVLLTNGGTGYTSVPTVGVTGVSGESITAILQIPPLLKVLSGITKNTGGSGYLSGGAGTLPIIFSGGGGTGATGYATVAAGVVTSATLTNAGTSYTSAPSATVNGSHSVAATLTVATTAAAALLTKQIQVPAEGQFESLFLQVTRVWDTLPGPQVRTKEWSKGGLQQSTEVQEVLPTSALAGGTNVTGERLEGQTAAKSRHITTIILDGSGNPVEANLAIYTEAVRDGHFEVTIYHDYFPVAPSYTVPSEGSSWPATAPIGQVLSSTKHAVDGSPNMIAEVIYIRALPTPRVEQPEIPFDFPGEFQQLQPWWNSDNIPGPYRRPYVGKDLDIYVIEPKRLSNRGRRIYFYTYGPANDPSNLFSVNRLSGNFYLPDTYSVITPATGSKVYRGFIHENMIHPEFVAYYQDATGTLIVTEHFEASTPASYDPDSVLISKASSLKWAHGGRVYENIIEQVSENTPPESFAPIAIAVPMYATPDVTMERLGVLFGDSGFGFDEGTPLNLVSSASDTRTVRIIGRDLRKAGPRESPFHTEDIVLNGTTQIQTIEQTWFRIFQITLSATASSTVSVTVPGQPNSGTILAITASTAAADTLTLARTSGALTDTRVFTFRKPAATLLTCGTKATLPVNAYFVVYDQYSGAVVVGPTAFWYYTGSESAPASMHRTVKIDISALSTAAEVFIATRDAVVNDVAAAADGELHQFDVLATGLATNQMAITDRYLGVRTASAFGAGVYGGAWAIAVDNAGTATAVNQLRLNSRARINYIAKGILTYQTADVETNLNISQAIGDNSAALASGAVSASTTALSYESIISATTPDAITTTVTVTDPENSTFTFTASNPTGLAASSPAGFGDGITLASFGANKTTSFVPINFNDANIAQLDLPAGVSVTTDPVALGGHTGTFVMRAGPQMGENGYPMPPITVSYEVSYDGSNWEASGDTLKKLANGTVHRHTIINHTFTTPPTTSVQPNYVRATFNNAAGRNRAIASYVELIIS